MTPEQSGRLYLEARKELLDLSERQPRLICPMFSLDSDLYKESGIAVDILANPLKMMCQNALVVISGTHGIEGLPGSILQRELLRDGLLEEVQDEVAVYLVHALNPWGFYYMQRTDHFNVDVNRGCFVKKGKNPNYKKVRHLVEPQMLTEDALQKIRSLSPDEFRDLFRSTVPGQYSYPTGIFYGGNKPCWSFGALEVLSKIMSLHSRVAVIDIHIGLGPYAKATLISPLVMKDGLDAKRTESWYGTNVQYPNANGPSVAAGVHGDVLNALARFLSGVEFTGIALEMGTTAPAESFPALVAENWIQNNPEKIKDVDPQLIARELEIFRKTFAPADDEVWMAALRASFKDIWQKTLAGLYR